jgi:hypothetical protein
VPAERQYAWPRFWTPPGEGVDDGFFVDPASIFARSPGARRLGDLVDEPCLVLLGEPGLGKSHAIGDAVAELRQAGRQVHRVNLGAYEEAESLISAIIDSAAWRTWRGSESVLIVFLDGLDEALLHVKAIHKRLIVLLQELGQDLQRLRLRISCRSAEWLPGFDGELARVFDSTDVPSHLALAPLRASDAAEAARAEGLDGDRFVSEIFERDLGRLAAFPLTLRMMLDVIASSGGALPETQAKLFDRAILRLAEEHDAGRRRASMGRALHVGRRVAIAERIAAALILAGKAAIASDLTTGSGSDLTIRELEGFSEQDPEAAGGASFPVAVEQVQEVLATALFVDLGGGRLTFAHRSIAEYLAARYLARHQMDEEQVMSLLASPDDPDGRLIPQLREVAAWAATMDEAVLDEVLDREPETLLRTESLPFGDEARARIAESLLTDSAAMRVERYDRRIRRRFAKLAHPGLHDQIRDALRPGRSIAVRQVAFTLAEAAALPELQPDLVSFAFNRKEPAYLRDDAVWALKDYADDDTRRALIPLATELIEDDEDDEIKGQALAATFPSVLGVTEVLRVLTPARNEHLLGAYKSFILQTLPKALQAAELPAALTWAQTAPRVHAPTDLLASLADDILAAAWHHLDDEAIRAGVIAVIAPRLAEHQELLGPLHDSDDTLTFREEPGRRLLVRDLIDVGTSDEIDASWLTWSEPALVLPADYSWVTQRLREAIGRPSEPRWAALAASLFTPEMCDVDEMFDLADSSPPFHERTAQWRTAIALDSELARMWAQRAARDRDQPPPDAPDMDDVVRDHLDAIEAGDIERWWRLNLDLLYDRHGRGNWAREIEADITQLDGWARADGTERSRILAAARRYVDLSPPDSADWFGTNKINRPAFAGYRALHLLAKHRPAQLDALDAAAWTRWVPILVSYPRSSGTDDERFDDVLIALAADRAPEALAQWTARMIDVQNAERDGHLFVMWRLRHVRSPELIKALAAKLADPQLKPQARGDLTEFGLPADPQTFLPVVGDQLTPEAIERDPEAALMVAAAALSSAPGAMWPMVESAFRSSPELGSRAFEKVAYGGRPDLAGELDDDALYRLVDWLFENLPPAEDPPDQGGAHYVSPREQAGQLRDRLLAVLAQRGSDDAIAYVDALASKFPGYAMTRRKAEAREARLARWAAPEPRDVIRLAQSNDARIVLSDAHLQQAVMGSLRRIEKRLQESSPPAARELWNTRGTLTPKYEEELSTWLKGRLEDDLRIGGRVIGRELEVRPNPTGHGRGESVDLAVFAPVGTQVEGAATASVTIEVKGCWHEDVKTSMETQLVDRYLTGTATTHGIYLVFWFAADYWDPADSRRRRCIRDPQTLHDGLAEQARSIAAKRHATVRPFVLDGSLPPHTGRARRIRRLLTRVLGGGP